MLGAMNVMASIGLLAVVVHGFGGAAFSPGHVSRLAASGSAGHRAWSVGGRNRGSEISPKGNGALASCRPLGLRMATSSSASVSSLTGPDPFTHVKDDMGLLKGKLKKMAQLNLKQSEEQINKASGGMLGSGSPLGIKNLVERPEKSWRPMVIILLAQMLGEGKEGKQLGKSEYLAMAEIVEIMHMSTVIHDTVLEDGDTYEKGNAAHKMYSSNIAGNKVSILAGDALLSRASVLSASLRNNDVVELVAGALESLMVGQMELHRPTRGQQPPLNAYVSNVVLRSGNLMGKVCEACAILAGYAPDHPRVAAAREYGLNLAITYQVLRDLHITEANYAKLLNKISTEGKRAEGVHFEADETNEALARAGPLLYASVIFPELQEMAHKGFGSVSDVLHARSLIERCSGVEGIRRLAEYHASLALQALDAFALAGEEGVARRSEADAALRVLVGYVLEDGQGRLLRKNYKDGVWNGPGPAGSSAGVERTVEKKAKEELYSRLDKLYGKGVQYAKSAVLFPWQGVEYAKDLVMSSMRGARDKASYDIGQLHRSLVRDAVLLFGKNVDVETVHQYIHGQCAFRASACEVEAMMIAEIRWQIDNGVETEADLEVLKSGMSAWDVGLAMGMVPQLVDYGNEYGNEAV